MLMSFVNIPHSSYLGINSCISLSYKLSSLSVFLLHSVAVSVSVSLSVSNLRSQSQVSVSV